MADPHPARTAFEPEQADPEVAWSQYVDDQMQLLEQVHRVVALVHTESTDEDLLAHLAAKANALIAASSRRFPPGIDLRGLPPAELARGVELHQRMSTGITDLTRALERVRSRIETLNHRRLSGPGESQHIDVIG